MPSATRIGIAIVERDGHFLVGQRSADGPLAGYAEFPGGKCLPDESPEKTAQRECLEETGLNVTPIELLDERLFSYPHGDVHLFFWRCAIETSETDSLSQTAGEPQNGFRWVAHHALKSLNFPEANVSVLNKLLGR